MAKELSGLSIPRALVEYLLLGPADDQRQLQDSPILGDVWLAYAKEPAGIQDLLITPHWNATAGRVANAIVNGLKTTGGNRTNKQETAKVAYLQGIVAAKLSFEELLRIIVPVTKWWSDRKIPDRLKDTSTVGEMGKRVGALLAEFSETQSVAEVKPTHHFSPLERYTAMAGLILWAGRQKRQDKTKAGSPATDRILKKIKPLTDEMVREVLDLSTQPAGSPSGAPAENLIFYVSLNRRAMPAVEKSVAAVKADAARTLFQVACDKITWAILDSGIDAGHQAFQDGNGQSRVKSTYDFTRIRDILSRDNLDDQARKERIDRLREGTTLNKADAEKYLEQLAKEANEERPPNWALIERFVHLDQPGVPTSVHGTHVAGILGAAPVGAYARGMCPDIQLYDFRVLARTPEETEFAIVGALQYIRHINEQHNYTSIHGANLSLSIPHNVDNYACGRTPICNECERLVASGVVVVAAAGNRGYQKFQTADGLYEGYAAFSITDPGNADGVITVGATHRDWPHTYGVSFFSSRGPTGDGRLKPDLVAPGEHIQAPMPCNEWGFESGTSMATPHVSGAAAMLMARYPELVGQPQRIKRILCETATDLGRERSFQGHGMLDVLRAFQSI